MLNSLLQYLPYLSPTALFLVIALVVTTFSSAGLVAIWAGLGKPHWFFRMAVVVALSAIPLIIPAYELIVLFWTQSALTILPLLILRRYRGPASLPGEAGAVVPGRAQVFLRDLLLLTAIAAGVSAIVARIPRDIWAEWPYLLLSGLGLAILTLFGAWIGLGRSRWWIRLLAACLLSPAALIALFLGLMRIAHPSGKATRRSWIRRASQAALLVLIFLPPSLAFYKFLTPLPIPETASVQPNGYSNLLQAAQPLANIAIPTDADTLETLQSFVALHRSELDRAHAALRQPCQTPLRYDGSDMERGFTEILSLRQLARAFDAEALLAHREGRSDDAIRIALDEYRLSDAVSRGRLKVDMLVGIAFEGIGACRIAKIRSSLSAKQCPELIDTLQEFEARREPLEEVIARDMAWEDRVLPWQDRLLTIISRTMADATGYGVDACGRLHQTRRQLLLGELAVHLYLWEHGEPPEALTDLVPQYLPSVPIDPMNPFSGSPLIYRRTSTGYLLYSVGYDGTDDGGRAVPNPVSSGDLLLDDPSDAGAEESQSGNPGP